ncbi:MAG TPA: ribosome small subunit-dependent GTPase A [Mycobacteriales bacterium]|nr:ribosome small subunit-dependent GTPase A [Mycobacteriales bacterium]
MTVDRGRYGCLLDDGTLVTAMRARELGRRSVVVGDTVAVVGDVSGTVDTLARIVRVEERRSVLRRTADDVDPVERVLVANADQLIVVCSVTEPPPQPRLVDRCLVAAEDAGVRPVLCVTKTDLGPAEDLLAIYRQVGDLDVVLSGFDDGGRGRSRLHDLLPGHVTVLVGSSGVGKSTLVNALIPDAVQRVGAVSEATGKGTHTTTAAIALPLPDEAGWLVDTPGVRSFGLAHIGRDRLVHCFPDLAPGTAECPGDCDHLDPEVCELDAWVAAGSADPERLDSLRRLLVNRDAG